MNNPPAFPDSYGNSGMTLRDYFAAKALVFFSYESKDARLLEQGQYPDHALVAKACYDMADAMLLAREKGQP